MYAYWYPDGAAINPQPAPTYLVLSNADDPHVLDTLRQRGWAYSEVTEFWQPHGSRYTVFRLSAPLGGGG